MNSTALGAENIIFISEAHEKFYYEKLKEVRYLDVHQNYVTVHARQDYTLKRTLAEFEAELDEQFFRVGRGMILNLKQIRRVTKKEVVLADGTVLPLPRGSYEPLNRAIIERT